jgi:glycosyltransferase involved in cell wall biosynthesis
VLLNRSINGDAVEAAANVAKPLKPGAETAHRHPRLAFFFGPLGLGGVARNRVHLAEALVARGVAVDLVAMRVTDEGRDTVPAGVRLFDLGTRSVRQGLPRLIRYLREERPQVMIACTETQNVLACLAWRYIGLPERLLLSTHIAPSRELAASRYWFDRKILPRVMRHTFRWADGLLAVSIGAAEDLADLIGLPGSAVNVIYNPVVTDTLLERAKEPADHPWLTEKDRPVVIAAGRLCEQKDFTTLLRAFRRVVDHRPARLIILGRGRLLGELKALAGELGIAERVDFHGHVPNPVAYFAAADLFVLSSAWEGFGNVLVEAMVAGCPVVSTDCPSGPREILEDGRYGRLAQVGDPQALAEAMLSTLDAPPYPEALKARAMHFHVDSIVEHFLDVVGLSLPQLAAPRKPAAYAGSGS